MYSKEMLERFGFLKIKVGDRISITKNNETFEGLLMPRPEIGDENTLILKQNDGYNIGINAAKAEIKKLGEAEGKVSFPKTTIKQNKSLPKVTILYTGGTIGSKVDYVSGGVIVLTTPEELLASVPEAQEIANIEVKDVMHTFSEDITFLEWQKISEEVKKAFDSGSVGVVVTMGTDTMHYTAAAMSFMVQDLPGPVVITGAQRSTDRGSSDAFLNINCALRIAAQSDIGEVGICMHESSSDNSCSFIRGTKARKMHTSRRDAFKPINSIPIASISAGGEITYRGSYRKADRKASARLANRYEPKVVLIKVAPSSDPGVVDYYISQGYRGIIFEGTGLGQLPVSAKHSEFNWLSALKKASEKGLVIGIASQCLYGRVNEWVYSNARMQRAAGAIYCEDMLPETAYVKLGWLLGNYKAGEAKEMLPKNIVGEISERTTYDEFHG